jgi:ADP-ribose pyrophosphatase
MTPNSCKIKILRKGKIVKNKFKVLSKETLFKAYFKVDQYNIKYQKFDGQWSTSVCREVFERGNAVAVLPYDPVQKKIILIEQFRIGAINRQPSPWLLEVVAGIIEKGESIEAVARREMLEEAGLTVQALHPIYHYWASPGACTEEVHLYCGIVDASKAGGIHGVATEEEDIKVHVIPQDDAFEWLKANKINNASTVIALQWLVLNHQQLFS